MSKKPTSLLSAVQPLSITPKPPEAEEQSTQPAMPAAVPRATAADKLTVYVPKAAAKRLKLMAIEHDKTVNDFLREGVNLMLAKYGEKALEEYEA